MDELDVSPEIKNWSYCASLVKLLLTLDNGCILQLGRPTIFSNCQPAILISLTLPLPVRSRCIEANTVKRHLLVGIGMLNLM